MQYAEGFGNYIYIVFAVVYVIYSIIKAGKKVSKNRPTINPQPSSSPTVQPPVSSPPPQRHPEDDLKKMLEDLFGGSPEADIPEKQDVKPKPSTIFSKPAPAKIAPHHPKKEGLVTQSVPLAPQKSVAAEKTHFISHPEITQGIFAETLPEEEPEIDFDIRQAVIYSEILKRPQV